MAVMVTHTPYAYYLQCTFLRQTVLEREEGKRWMTFWLICWKEWQSDLYAEKNDILAYMLKRMTFWLICWKEWHSDLYVEKNDILILYAEKNDILIYMLKEWHSDLYAGKNDILCWKECIGHKKSWESVAYILLLFLLLLLIIIIIATALVTSMTSKKTSVSWFRFVYVQFGTNQLKDKASLSAFLFICFSSFFFQRSSPIPPLLGIHGPSPRGMITPVLRITGVNQVTRHMNSAHSSLPVRTHLSC